MKRLKKLIILLGVLVVIFAATLAVKQIEEHKEQIRTSGDVVLSVSADDVNTLSWDYDDTSLAFHKSDDDWFWDEDEAFPVDREKMEKLISDFESLNAAFIIEDADDLSQYGLDEPTCTINLTEGEEERQILLGDFSAMDSQRYVSIGDGNVYLVKDDPFDDYEVELKDMVKNDEIPSISGISTIEFTGNENYTVTYEEESKNTYCKDDKYFTSQDGKSLPLDTDSVNSYVSALKGTDLSEYCSYNVSEEELEDWGLNNPALTVSIAYTAKDEEGKESSKNFVLNLGLNQEEQAKKDEAEKKGEEYSGSVTTYARVGESQLVYELSASKASALLAAAYDDLRHKDVFTADFDEVSSIYISLEGGNYTISADGTDDDGKYLFDGGEVDIADLTSKILALNIEKFSDEQPAEKEEIGLSFALDNENFSQMSVDIYRYDGSNCLVVLNGETLGLVKRTNVVNLIEAVNTIILG